MQFLAVKLELPGLGVRIWHKCQIPSPSLSRCQDAQVPTCSPPPPPCSISCCPPWAPNKAVGLRRLRPCTGLSPWKVAQMHFMAHLWYAEAGTRNFGLGPQLPSWMSWLWCKAFLQSFRWILSWRCKVVVLLPENNETPVLLLSSQIQYNIYSNPEEIPWHLGLEQIASAQL